MGHWTPTGVEPKDYDDDDDDDVYRDNTDIARLYTLNKLSHN